MAKKPYEFKVNVDSSQSLKEIKKLENAFLIAAKQLEKYQTIMDAIKKRIEEFPPLIIQYEIIEKKKKWYQFWK